jgi:hypothetical protein
MSVAFSNNKERAWWERKRGTREIKDHNPPVKSAICTPAKRAYLDPERSRDIPTTPPKTPVGKGKEKEEKRIEFLGTSGGSPD